MSENRRTLDTGTDTLLAHVEDGVAVITLNRPEARNALSDDLSPAFRNLLETIPEDPGIRAVLVTGAGTAFCAGGDVKGMGGGAERRGPAPTREEIISEQTTRQRRLTGALYALPQPTLAALPGPAAGGGEPHPRQNFRVLGLRAPHSGHVARVARCRSRNRRRSSMVSRRFGYRFTGSFAIIRSITCHSWAETCSLASGSGLGSCVRIE